MGATPIPQPTAASGVTVPAAMQPGRDVGRYYDFCMEGDTIGALGLIPNLGIVTWQAGIVPVGGSYDQVLLRSLGTAPCNTRVALYEGADDDDGIPNGWPAGAPIAEAQIATQGIQADNVAVVSVTLVAGQLVWVWLAADTANRSQLYRNDDTYKAPGEPRGLGAHPAGFSNPQENPARGAGDPAPTLAAAGYDLIDNGNGVEGNGFAILWRLSA